MTIKELKRNLDKLPDDLDISIMLVGDSEEFGIVPLCLTSIKDIVASYSSRNDKTERFLITTRIETDSLNNGFSYNFKHGK